MDGRFWIFGVIVSVAVHAAVLLVLSLSSTAPASVTAEPPTAPQSAVPAEPERQPSQDEPPPDEPEQAVTRSAPAPASHPVTLPVARTAPVHEPAPTPEKEWVTYVVKKGDMLERLVKKAGCSISEAARYNKTTVKKLSALKVGQRIKLPKFQED